MINILSISIVIIIAIPVILAFAAVIFFFLIKNKPKSEKMTKKTEISEWSYQRFCLFYGNMILPDPNFNNKIESIKKSILDDKVESIDEIASKSGCSFDECVLKIRYLKNKRIIGDYEINISNRKVKKCSLEDSKLLEKYKDLLYTKHCQIEEMANEVPNYHNMPVAILKEDIFKDIKYLNDKMLINGIIFRENEKKIIYYCIEKNKREKTHKTVNCPSCGALVGIPNGGQGKCILCGNVVVDEILNNEENNKKENAKG